VHVRITGYLPGRDECGRRVLLLRPRKWLLLGAAAVALLTGVLIYALGALQPLQDGAIDEGFALAGAHRPPAGIVIVAVDNATLQRIDAQLPIPRSYYARLLDVLHRAQPKLIGLDLQFIGTSADPRQDQALLSAFARDGPVLVSVTDSGTGVPTIVGVSQPSGVVPASGAVDTDSDGVLRKLMYVQVRLQTFAIRAAEMVEGRPIPASQVLGNQAWIDFAGPPGTFRTYSMADVLDGAVPSAAFAGKIVLVGVTAPIGKDVFTTAASPDPMSGVEVQANAIETVLRGFPLKSADPWLSAVLIIVLALTPVALGLRASSLLVVLSAPLIAAVFLGLAVLAFDHGLILPVPAPILALVIATGGAVAVESLIERRQRRALDALLRPFLRPGKNAFFLSYRRDQSGFVARQLRTALAARFGEQSVFMDEVTISPGQTWPRAIPEAIMGCQAMLVIIGKYWLAAPGAAPGSRRLDDPGDWVRREVEEGLARPEAAVIPVLTDGATMPDRADLPPSLQPLCDRQAFSLAGDDLDREVDALIDGIRSGRLAPLRLAGAAHVPSDGRDLRLVKWRRRERAVDAGSLTGK
jgi:CHASE2 domain-containing sensor protein